MLTSSFGRNANLMSNEVINSVVEVLATVSLVGAVGFLLAASFARPGMRIPKVKVAAWFVAGFLAVMGANYAYIFGVVLPEQARKSQEARRAREDEAAKVRVGQIAPAFRVRTLDGNVFDLSEQRGKVVLLNYFATWCGPCMQELPHIEELWKRHGGQADFALLVVDREESAATAAAFMKEKGFTFPVAADPKRQVYSLYAKELIPRTFIIDRKGTITYSSTGFYDEDLPKFKEQLATALAQR